MSENNMTPVKATLLWLAILPGAILSAMIVHLLFMLIQIIFGTSDGEPTLWHQILGSAVFGGVFVYAGYFIAPYHKKVVSTILAGIVLFLSGMIVMGSLDWKYTLTIIGTIAMNIASIAVCVNAWNDNLD